MTDRDPNIIYSSHGGIVTEQGITVELSIHRLEDRPGWAMEVVNQQGTSTVWNELSKQMTRHSRNFGAPSIRKG